MTEGKSDNNTLPPDDSPRAKDGSTQSNLTPEDSQVLKEFPWLKNLKSEKLPAEVTPPTEAALQDSENKPANPQKVEDDPEQGRSKKKKRGNTNKKGQTKSSNQAGAAPTQKPKHGKPNKKGKSSAQPQVEPSNAETVPALQSSFKSDSQTNLVTENEISAPSETEASMEPEKGNSDMPEMETSAPPELETIAARVDQQSDAPESHANPQARVVAKTSLEVDISSFSEQGLAEHLKDAPKSEPDMNTQETPTPQRERIVSKTLIEAYISSLTDSEPIDSADKNIAPAAVPDSTPPPTNRVPKTMLEIDISKFAVNAQTATPGVTPEIQQHSEPAPPLPQEMFQQKRVIPKTQLETDISKFVDSPSNDSLDKNVPPETAPADTPPPANRVAKTMLEIDISKFADTPQTPVPDATPQLQQPSDPAPAIQQNRKVARTLLETDISKFTGPDQLTADQSTEIKSASENRVVPRTLLETDITKFTESHLPDYTAEQHTDPAQQTNQPSRAVPKTLLETDISQFAERHQPTEQYSDRIEKSPEPMDSPIPQRLSKADSPSFADVEMQQQINLVQGPDNLVSQQQQQQQQQEERQAEGNTQSAQNKFPSYEQPNDGNFAEDRNAPKTLLDMDLIHTTLGNSIVRLEAAAEQRATQAQKEFEPIEDFKLSTPNCPWRWDDPHTKDRIAFCEQCGAQAYNFAGLQMPEALKLIYQRENIEKPKLFKREDGKFMTRDCPMAQKKAAMPFLIIGVGCLVVALIALLFMVMPKPAPQVVEQPTSETQSAATNSSTKGANHSSQGNANTQSQVGASSSSGVQSTSIPSSTTSASPANQGGLGVVHTKVYDHNPSNAANSSTPR